MTDPINDNITLYTSSWCTHAINVGRFLKRHGIAVEQIDIDEVPGARQKLIELNGGNASVPTLVFSDGSKMTEPSLFELRSRLKLGRSTGLKQKLRSLVSGSDRSSD